MNLKIINADKKLLKALKSVVALDSNAKLKVEKNLKKKNLEEEIYTREFIESLEEMEREFEEERRNGTLKTYSSVEEAFKAEGLI